MAGELERKTALVTGGSRGIGAAIAKELAGHGALVAVHYGTRSEDADRVVREIEQSGGAAFAVQADLRRLADIDNLFAQLDKTFGQRTGDTGLDILVNNAGSSARGGFTQITEEAFDAVFDLNVKGLFFVCQQAIPRLRDNGRVVNISSMASRGAMLTTPAYGAAKRAVNSLSLSLAAELGPRRITVNAIAPGATATDFISEALKDPAFEQPIIAATAFRRIGQVQDIADAVWMLVSPRAAWVTGQVIEVSGGLRL
jgi:3-oxoacyl-[acyl-carrier protein] reductase